MKRLLLTLSILFSVPSYANCYEFELIGEGQIENEELIFLLAKGTLSEVKLTVPFGDQNLFTPYIDRWARATLILNSSKLDFNTKIVKVIKVDYETPDPLNMMARKNIKQIGKVLCPKE